MQGSSGLTLAFDNGREITIRAKDISDSVLEQALLHGLKQKLVDAAAISRNTETGRAASTQDKFDAVKEVYDRLLAGQWNKGREGGNGGGAGGLLYRALVIMYPGKTPEQLRAYLDGLDDKQQAALRKNPKVAPIIAEIRAKSAKTGTDGDDLLAGLED
jgi:hypothetical protein